MPVTAPPKSNFRTMATCDLHLNRPLGPVLNDTTVIPPYPYCLGDSPRWHGPRDVVKRPVLGHGSTCQFGYLHNPEALANLRAHEARTIELMSSWSRCGTSLLDTVEAMAEASGGASTSSAPLSCSIVFIGDSHTYQALDAAVCNLRDSVLKADQQRQPPPKKDPKPALLQTLLYEHLKLYPSARVPLRSHIKLSNRSFVDLSVGFIPRSGHAAAQHDFFELANFSKVHPMLREANDVMNEKALTWLPIEAPPR